MPIGDPALEKLGFEVTAEQRELADLDTENFDFEPSITQVRGPLAVGVVHHGDAHHHRVRAGEDARTLC